MRSIQGLTALMLVGLMASPATLFGANHREAPITALDRAADITDWYAFISYNDATKATFILNVDPLLEPGNGPTYFPFDPDIVYAMKIDNNHDGVADVTFEFRFTTEYRAPNVFTAYVGAGTGFPAPSNAPRTAMGPAPGGIVVPPAIRALDGAGSEGLNLRQTYTVTMVKGAVGTATRTELGGTRKLYAVPTNVGPRTMPDYPVLARSGMYMLADGVRVFAATVDDPFYLDLGGAFDSLNFRGKFTSGTPGVLTAAQDASTMNIAPDGVAGYNVNSIVLEVPLNMILQDGLRFGPTDPRAVIGTWGTTSRPRTTIRRGPDEQAGTPTSDAMRQVQRMANPLINELIIGIGSKDKFSISEPKDDAQFASFVTDPVLARVLNAVYGIRVPDAPRTDLLILAQYIAPIAPAGTPRGPVADLLRLNTGIPPAAAASRSRLGVLGGDLAGWPNGRRVSDDVTDIALRAVAGVLGGQNQAPNNILGDGVNMNDVPYQETFPYVGFAQPGTLDRTARPTVVPNLGSIQCVNDPQSCTSN